MLVWVVRNKHDTLNSIWYTAKEARARAKALNEKWDEESYVTPFRLQGVPQ